VARQDTLAGRPLRLLAWLVLWLASAPAAAADWLTAETDEFVVLGDARPREINHVLEGLQIYRHVAGRFYPALLKAAPYKARIFVLRPSSFAKFTKQSGRIAGFVMPGDFSMDIVVEASSNNWMNSAVIVQHELTHFYLHLNYNRNLPVWFDEGLADFFSTIDFQGRRARIGIQPAMRHFALQVEPWIPLERMFATDRSSREYRDHRLAGAFYAQSWLLTHYLLMGGDADANSRVERMFRGLDVNIDLPRVIEQVFGSDWPEFEKKIRRYGAANIKRYSYFEAPKEALQLPPLAQANTEMANVEMADLVLRLSMLSAEDKELLVRELLPNATDARSAALRSASLLLVDQRAAAEPLLARCRDTAATHDAALACAQAWRSRLRFDVEESRDLEAIMPTVLALNEKALQSRPGSFAALYFILESSLVLQRLRPEVVVQAEQALQRLPSSFALRVAIVNSLRAVDNLEGARRHLEYAVLYERDPQRRSVALQLMRDLENELAAKAPGK
jgi:hypothetical protein